MPITDYISQGGRQPVSPLQRYYLGVKQKQNRESTRINQESAKQAMKINDVKLGIAEKEQATKSLAGLAQYLDTLPEEQRPQAFEAAKPKFESQGLPPLPPEVGYDQVKGRLERAKLEVFGESEGKRRNALLNGKVIPAIENKKGELLSTETGEHLKGATLAPSRQETAQVESFSGTDSQRGKIKKERVEAQVALEREVSGLDTLEKFVTSDDFVGGTAAQLYSSINSAAAQFRQTIGTDSVLQNGKLDESQIDPDSKELARLRRSSILSDSYDAALIEMAYIKAKQVDPSSKITDKDFAFARKMLQSGADKVSLVNVLRNERKKAISNYNRNERITSERYKGYEPVVYQEAQKADTEVGSDPRSIAQDWLKQEGLN